MEQILEINDKLFCQSMKPKLNLTPLEKTIIEIPTQKEYDELMQVYEAGEWRWESKDLPTSFNYWTNKEKIYVDAGISYSNGLKKFFKYGYEERNNYNVVSIKNFYGIQKITQENLIELNEYFEKNFPNRTSNRKMVNSNLNNIK